MQQLDAGNRDHRVSVVLQSQHRPQTPFHSTVILLGDIVEILARADRDDPRSSIFRPKLTNGPVRGLVSVEGDRARHPSVCLEGLAKKGFGGGHVALGAEAKVDGLTAGIHGAIQVDPAATKLDVRLIHPPRAADRACKAIPALLELGSVVLDPAQNGARRDGNPALGHHLGEIPVRELVAQIPTDAQDDDLGIEMTALEKLVEAQQLAHQAAHSRGIVEHSADNSKSNRYYFHKSNDFAMESAITTKGQATIPKAIRERLGLKAGDRVKFFVHPDGSVVLLPKRPAAALRGIVKARRAVTVDEMNEAAAAGATGRPLSRGQR
jgi:antitoxin PrlF